MWIVFGLLCALFHSIADLLYRRIGPDFPTEVLAFGRMGYTALVLWILVLFDGIPEFGPDLARAYSIGIPLELIATLLYLKALQLSPLSITAPIFAFSPAFLLVTGPLFLGESTSFVGGMGVLLIVAGAYTLHITKIREGFLAPVKSLTKETGAMIMLGAACIYSITASMGRLGVLNSSPAFFGATYFTAVAAALFVPVVVKRNVPVLFHPELTLPGVAAGISVLFHMKGVELVQVGYFISLKRVSLLFSILLGVFVLHEKGGRERFIGGTIMLAGVIVILLFR